MSSYDKNALANEEGGQLSASCGPADGQQLLTHQEEAAPEEPKAENLVKEEKLDIAEDETETLLDRYGTYLVGMILLYITKLIYCLFVTYP